MRFRNAFFLSLSLIGVVAALELQMPKSEIVAFPDGKLTLHGVLFKPNGKGPFPAVLYNHGSAPGMLNKQTSDILGPVYASHGWVFFMPYRRGQGLSAAAGPYIMDEVNAAEKSGGTPAAAATMSRILKTDHLDDQLSALAWLKKQQYVQPHRVAVAGNSFGGIETVLGAEKGAYCAAIDASGAAQSWSNAPEIQTVMLEAVRNSQAPIFFFQAENDYDQSPSNVLCGAMNKVGKKCLVRFYPAFGKTAKDGHSFAYLGSSVWSQDVFDFLGHYCR